jgi:predicted AAA+ superfamily ATPase
MSFKRRLEKDLLAWKQRAGHLPLLLRGARQVGKTSLVRTFAQRHYRQMVEINLEERPELAGCFDTLNPQEILQKISAYTQQPIIPGETLLFIDEIQQVPQAIQAMRYFKEKVPVLDVIGAGSLLELTLNQVSFQLPVGRVEFLYLKPLSFEEFLWALGAEPLWQAITESSLIKPLAPVLHQRAMDYVRDYFIVGGMPAAVVKYQEAKDYKEVQRIQQHLWLTYRGDFAKYGERISLAALHSIFDKMPLLVGQQTKYSKIHPEMRAAVLKEAVQLLTQAGVIYSIYATTAGGIPLNALLNEKKYKLLFLDVGLIVARTQLSAQVLMQPDIHLVNEGVLCEQFVGQELLAYQPPHVPAELFCWSREQKNSQAEVDFVMASDHQIVPIEVKAGASGWLKSLKLLMQEKQLPLGIRVSDQPLLKSGDLLSVPFYMLFRLYDLLTG